MNSADCISILIQVECFNYLTMIETPLLALYLGKYVLKGTQVEPFSARSRLSYASDLSEDNEMRLSYATELT